MVDIVRHLMAKGSARNQYRLNWEYLEEIDVKIFFTSLSMGWTGGGGGNMPPFLLIFNTDFGPMGRCGATFRTGSKIYF